MKKTLLSWSSGKDSAWALHTLRQNGEYNLCGLFTVVNQTFGRVAMHAVRLELLRLQAEAVGLPLTIIEIPHPCDNDQYDTIMRGFVERSVGAGIECMAFGDLFLQDIRTYREERLSGSGIEPIFPLWNIPTGPLAERMLSSGMEAYLSCVDPAKAPRSLAGHRWSRALLAALPERVDPCGENGEFHTVVLDGPMFDRRIPVTIGETVERDGFIFTDIVPELISERS
jgi:uncharacterized protein (TIGR00290 family)